VTLEFTISAPTRSRVGATVFIVLRLRNASHRPVEAHFLGRTIDILGLDRARALLHQLPPSSQRDRTLEFVDDARLALPGETMEWRDTWLPREPGHYRIQGILPSDEPEPLRTPWAQVEVSP